MASDFEDAVYFIANFRPGRDALNTQRFAPSNEDKLAFYSLYKQATLGQVSGSRPSMFDVVGRAKYDAWAAHGAMSKEDAAAEYVELLDVMYAEWRNWPMLPSKQRRGSSNPAPATALSASIRAADAELSSLERGAQTLAGAPASGGLGTSRTGGDGSFMLSPSTPTPSTSSHGSSRSSANANAARTAHGGAGVGPSSRILEHRQSSGDVGTGGSGRRSIGASGTALSSSLSGVVPAVRRAQGAEQPPASERTSLRAAYSELPDGQGFINRSAASGSGGDDGEGLGYYQQDEQSDTGGGGGGDNDGSGMRRPGRESLLGWLPEPAANLITGVASRLSSFAGFGGPVSGNGNRLVQQHRDADIGRRSRRSGAQSESATVGDEAALQRQQLHQLPYGGGDRDAYDEDGDGDAAGPDSVYADLVSPQRPVTVRQRRNNIRLQGRLPSAAGGYNGHVARSNGATSDASNADDGGAVADFTASNGASMLASGVGGSLHSPGAASVDIDGVHASFSPQAITIAGRRLTVEDTARILERRLSKAQLGRLCANLQAEVSGHEHRFVQAQALIEQLRMEGSIAFMSPSESRTGSNFNSGSVAARAGVRSGLGSESIRPLFRDGAAGGVASSSLQQHSSTAGAAARAAATGTQVGRLGPALRQPRDRTSLGAALDGAVRVLAQRTAALYRKYPASAFLVVLAALWMMMRLRRAASVIRLLTGR